MWFMVSLTQKTWKEKWKQDLGWYKSTLNLRNGHCLSYGDASFKEKGDVGARCNIMTSLNFSRKESIIFLFQIAHYNLSICNKHSNKTETKGSPRKNSIGKQREFLNEKPLTTSFLMGRQTTKQATVETPVL